MSEFKYKVGDKIRINKSPTRNYNFIHGIQLRVGFLIVSKARRCNKPECMECSGNGYRFEGDDPDFPERNHNWCCIEENTHRFNTPEIDLPKKFKI